MEGRKDCCDRNISSNRWSACDLNGSSWGKFYDKTISLRSSRRAATFQEFLHLFVERGLIYFLCGAFLQKYLNVLWYSKYGTWGLWILSTSFAEVDVFFNCHYYSRQVSHYLNRIISWQRGMCPAEPFMKYWKRSFTEHHHFVIWKWPNCSTSSTSSSTSRATMNSAF